MNELILVLLQLTAYRYKNVLLLMCQMNSRSEGKFWSSIFCFFFWKFVLRFLLNNENIFKKIIQDFIKNKWKKTCLEKFLSFLPFFSKFHIIKSNWISTHCKTHFLINGNNDNLLKIISLDYKININATK